MSRDNLDLVRSIYAAWERDDYGSADWAHPEIEFVLADGPDPGRWSGLDGMVQGWRALLSAWEGYRFKVEEFRELDDERVLVLIRLGGRGKASGLELDEVRAKAANLLHLRDGKVTRLALYFDRARALVDIGLEPEA